MHSRVDTVLTNWVRTAAARRYPVRMIKSTLAVLASLLVLASCGQEAKRDLTLTYFNLDG